MFRPDEEVQTLVCRAREGDREAFTALLQRYENAAANLALQLTANRHDAEEAVQKAALHFWRATPQLKPEEDARAFFLKIVARRAVEIIRGRRREAARDKEIAKMLSTTNSPSRTENLPGEHQETLSVLRNALGLLPSLERRLVTLYYGGNLSQNEIAELLEMPQRTVSFKIKEALTTLRERLTQAGVSAAAAAPLLEANGLSEALCSGIPTPPGLHEKVMARLANLSEKSGRASKTALRGRTSAPARGLLYALSAVALALAAVSVALWWNQSETPAPSRAPAPVSGPTNSGGDAGDTFQPVTWSFAAEPAARDLRLLLGAWSWQRDAALGEGAMLCAKDRDTALLLPTELPKRPLLLTAEVWPRAECTTFHWGAYLLQGDWMSSRRTWKNPANLKRTRTKQWRKFCAYIFERHIVSCLDGPDKAHLLQVTDELFPGNRLLLQLRNFGVRSIELRALDPREVPEPFADWEALAASMKEGPKQLKGGHFNEVSTEKQTP